MGILDSGHDFRFYICGCIRFLIVLNLWSSLSFSNIEFLKYFGDHLHFWSHTLGGFCYTGKWPPHQLRGERHFDWKIDHVHNHVFQGNAPQELARSVITLLNHERGALVPRVTLYISLGIALVRFGEFLEVKGAGWLNNILQFFHMFTQKARNIQIQPIWGYYYS